MATTETTPDMLRRLVSNMDCLDEDSIKQHVFIYDALKDIQASASKDLAIIPVKHRRWARTWLKAF